MNKLMDEWVNGWRKEGTTDEGTSIIITKDDFFESNIVFLYRLNKQTEFQTLYLLSVSLILRNQIKYISSWKECVLHRQLIQSRTLYSVLWGGERDAV